MFDLVKERENKWEISEMFGSWYDWFIWLHMSWFFVVVFSITIIVVLMGVEVQEGSELYLG